MDRLQSTGIVPAEDLEASFRDSIVSDVWSNPNASLTE
jgi:hypothetical protein